MTTTQNEPRKLIGEGTFRAKPKGGSLTRNGKGRDQYMVEFQLQNGADAGKHLTWWGGFEGKGFDYTTAALTTLGWDGDQGLDVFVPKNEVEIVVAHRTIPATADKPARVVAEVKYINPLDGSRPRNANIESTKLSGDAARSVSDGIKARMALRKEANGEAPSGGNGDVASAPGGDDDDIPF